jgi:hypothetical protein
MPDDCCPLAAFPLRKVYRLRELDPKTKLPTGRTLQLSEKTYQEIVRRITGADKKTP